ncbi:MAG: 6-carboxytetrahydropterin synthase [Nitrospinota bacterium]|nr:6-carboxytetrahydropterin synthase [Nitrospinota bacterium]
MYDITVKSTFSAAHRLKGYDGQYENLHGHNWIAIVTVRASELDSMEVGIDFVKLKQKVEEVLGRLDYQTLNEVPPFDTQNPSAENIARWLFKALKADINSATVKIQRVEIKEFEDCGAAYFE